MSTDPHLLPDHCNVPTDLRIKTESDDSLPGSGVGSSGVISSHTQLDQSSAPITSQQSMNLAAVIAASNEAVCSAAPGTKLHAAWLKPTNKTLYLATVPLLYYN